MYGIVPSHPCARGCEIYSQDYLHSFYTTIQNFEGPRKELKKEVGGEI
jgi:hypothetical protein